MFIRMHCTGVHVMGRQWLDRRPTHRVCARPLLCDQVVQRAIRLKWLNCVPTSRGYSAPCSPLSSLPVAVYAPPILQALLLATAVQAAEATRQASHRGQVAS
jgi:hypothetical protein